MQSPERASSDAPMPSKKASPSQSTADTSFTEGTNQAEEHQSTPETPEPPLPQSPSDTIAVKTRSVLRRLEQSYRNMSSPEAEAEVEAAAEPSSEAKETEVAVPNGTDDAVEETQSVRSRVGKMPPLLLRMPNTAFGIAMGLAGNSIMWKTACDSEFITDRVNADTANEIVWYTGVVAGTVVAAAYLYKIFTSFEIVKKEYQHPLRIHFMNGPHLALIMLALGVPKTIGINTNCMRALWGIGFFAQTCITQFIYEKWMFSQTHNLSVARPQLLLSTVGWFLLAVLGQRSDIEEAWGLALPSFCFGAGTIFYLLVVTGIFTRIHRCSECKGSPALTLLIAPPSVAVVALDGFDSSPDEFGVVAEMVLGWCLVIFLLLLKLGPMIAGTPSVFGAYWAYVFPLSALGNACIQYAKVVGTGASEVMAAVFLCVAMLAVVVVFVRMTYHIVLCCLGEDQWADPLVKRVEPDEANEGGSEGA